MFILITIFLFIQIHNGLQNFGLILWEHLWEEKKKTLENEYLLASWGKNRIMTAVPANIVCKWFHVISYKCFSNGSMGKNLPAMWETKYTGSIPWSGKSSEGRNGNALQYSCLKSPMDRGAWEATVQRATKSWTQLSDSAQFHINS